MRKKEDERGSQLMQFASCILLGGAIGLIVCVLLLFVCSIGISNGWISGEYMMQCTVMACLVAGFLGGIYSVSKLKKKTLLVGAGAGMVQFLISLTAGVIFFPSVSIDNMGVVLLCASLFGGALAGLLGGKQKKKRRK